MLLQSMEKPTKLEPAAALAARVSSLPTSKLAVQVCPQSRPAGVDVMVPVPTGSTGEYSVAFGFQRSSTAPEATAVPAAQSGDRFRTALFGALGVMLLLLAAGLAVTLFMRRR